MNRTEKDISDAFWQILEEKPYNRITVKDIVDRCQVNRNTFYYHFEDIPSLTEYTIQDWADEIIQQHYKFGSPASCIIPLIQGCIKRKGAILHIYRSVHREAFMHYLDEINRHIVKAYVEYAAGEATVSTEDRDALLWFYKCMFDVLAIMIVRSINFRPVCGSISSGNSVNTSTTSFARSPQAAITTISASACFEIA